MGHGSHWEAVGAGYMLEYTGLDSLAPVGEVRKLTYLSKEALEEVSE